MNPQVIFWIVFAVFLFLVIYSNIKYNLLKDLSSASRRPYSFSRVQLTWWTIIILTSLITILLYKGVIPTFSTSILILLGISSATTAAGQTIDLSDQTNHVSRAQDLDSDNFILDILSDSHGICIHRFQTVVFNLVFGIWFMCTVIYNLNNFAGSVNNVMPIISEQNLILLGLSSGTYAALKITENKSK